MRDLSYTHLLLKSFSDFVVYIKNSFLSIIIISIFPPALKFCLYHIVGGGWYILAFDAFSKPLFLIALFVVLADCSSVVDSSFYKKLMNKVRSKYIKLLTLYFIITFFSAYLGSGTVILHSVMFLKMPFIEVMLFSSGVGLLEAAKRNNSITQDKLLRYLLILLLSFLLVRTLMIRGLNSLPVSGHRETIGLAAEFIKSLFVMLYFSYIFAFYNLLKTEKMYLK